MSEDISDAREREIEVTTSLKKRDWVMEGIAISVVVGYFCMCGIVTFIHLPSDSHDILNMLFGQLMGGFMMVLSYYFGSSNK